jgi:hypothetical protein
VEADFAAEVREAARRPGVVSAPLEQAPDSTGSAGPPVISGTSTETITIFIIIITTMTSFSSVSVIRSFIPSVTAIIRSDILTVMRPTVTRADMATDMEAELTDPGMKLRVQRL